MTYQETIDFLYSRLPVFHQIGARAFKPGLDTTYMLCESLGNPQLSYRNIHVGGTNGKGSTSHMLASILQQAGYKVGLYTSPHLKSFTERIKINGEPINEQFIVNFVSENLSNIDRLEPSFFELTVGMAFSYFAEHTVDFAIIEVGMGGRYDSTNVIRPILSVITNISMDHVQFLGDTILKIADQKSGIIKEGIPVVVSEFQSDEIAAVFNAQAAYLNTAVTYGSKRFEVRDLGAQEGKLHIDVLDLDSGDIIYSDLILGLSGQYQLLNVCGVLAAIQELLLQGISIDDHAIRNGLESFAQDTGLKGRWQLLNARPLVICDTAHNYAGLSGTILQFGRIKSTQRRYVIGFVADKDVKEILGLFPRDGIFYFCQPSIQRAFSSDELSNIAQSFGLNGTIFADVNQALKCAVSDSKDSDTIYIGGSTFVVADLDEL
jgi:dihydrofolate synthase/folylpolyglutamate synthase